MTSILSSGTDATARSKEEIPNSEFRSKVLRGNLTRTHKNRDPLFYYEVQQVLGVGSMGSVVKIKKRDEIVGGSAREDLQGAFRQEKIAQHCMKIPFCGWFAEHCLWNPLSNSQQGSMSESVRSIISSVTGSNRSPFKAMSDSNRSLASAEGSSPTRAKTRKEFAMKSIHLSRVTDKTFEEELRNEIVLLKALDHPHIGAPDYSILIELQN